MVSSAGLGGRKVNPFAIELLEDRCVPATFTVDTLSDNPADGDTLREAIALANANADADIIDFVTTLNGTIDASGTGEFQINTGSLTIDASMVTGSITVDVGGNGRVFYVNGDIDVVIDSLTITGGDTTNSGGGILLSSAAGSLTVNNSLITGNSAGNDGGGLYNSGGGTLTVFESVVTSNNAGTGSGNVGGGIGSSSGYLNITNSEVSNNTAFRTGGIFTYGVTTITNSIIDGNITTESPGGGFGGGISSGNSLTLINSTVTNNITPGSNGGGGIRIGGGTGLVVNSTISGNQALLGGGIHVVSATVDIINSTISGNTSTGTGGGIHNSNGTVNITNSTITDNSATTNGGGIYNNSTLTVNNSIIAGNTATTMGNDFFDNVADTATGANNLFTTGGVTQNANFAAGTNGNIETADVNSVLAPLADNGGPTMTHALLEGSIAINAGDNALAVDEMMNALTTDQRGAGFDRIIDSIVDIGAFEFNQASSGVLSSDVGGTTFRAFTANITGSNVQLDDIVVTGGVARQLIDNGDGTYTFIVAPNAVGNVSITAPGVGAGEIMTVFNPLTFGSTNEDFVRNLYTVIFARSASDAEVELWTTQMADGAGRVDVIAGFLASDEYTGMFDGNAGLVDGIYQTLFERDADTDFWTNELNEGTSLETVLRGILSSEEFYTRVVQETYNEFLLRPSDDMGQAYWVDELLAGNLSVEQLRAEFESSAEAQSV